MPRATTRLIATGLLTTFAAAGCESLRSLGRADRAAVVGTGVVQPREAAALVNYLNEQAAAVNGLRYTRVAMGVKIPGDSYNLGQSQLACEKPRNFSLVGGKGIADELVILGSNDREFWFYSRFPQKTYLYCSHADLPAVAAKLPVPFDPDWAMQALGLYTYPAGLDYQVQTLQNEREYHLSYPHATPGGRPVRVTVVFAADEQVGYSPQVRRMVIEDAATNQVVATADIKAVTREAGPKGGVPTNLELAWPQQQASLTLDLGEPAVNPQFTPKLETYYFTRRDMGVEALDLTRVQFRGSARAQSPGAGEGAGARHVADRKRWWR